MTADDDKILTRVRKLLDLANNEAASEGERDNGLRMAYNLLAKHELDMDDVAEHTREKVDPRGHFQNEGWNLVWCKHVRKTIANLFMCKYYGGAKINATRGEHHWVGRESNATTAMYMADWIIRSLLKEADKRYKHRLTPEGRAFCIGASDELRRRVQEILAQKQAEIASTGSSLVLVDKAESELASNTAYIRDVLGIKLVVHKGRRSSVDLGAWGAGKEYGAGIGLHTQMTNKKGTLAIK